jgi:hypothetical protein
MPDSGEVDDSVFAGKMPDLTVTDQDLDRICVIWVLGLGNEGGDAFATNSVAREAAGELPQVVLMKGLADHLKCLVAAKNLATDCGLLRPLGYTSLRAAEDTVEEAHPSEIAPHASVGQSIMRLSAQRPECAVTAALDLR